ncbi:MAG: phosphate ABC transporter ATP-binding protein [Firmicutes bacterium]|nr:phosphate ABC transporter ATP-binding protein [Alicyclobacillaceae bacterium]MCL6496203.1 phosphate ABC transporter ATP-binding protein [Bacillota bacterium]
MFYGKADARPNATDRAGLPWLRVSNVSLTVGHRAILQKIYLELQPGTVTALVGPSGSGKSSLLRVLNRLWDGIPGARVSGQVWFLGQNLYGPGVDVTWVRSRIGMVFQRPTPFPWSIYENLAIPLRVQGVPRRAIPDRVEEALRRAALWDEVKDRLREPALTLSGGQQQRLCIARALAVEPAVLLLDEPASALDPVSRGRIRELLAALRGQVTVLLVTHHLDDAVSVADYTGVLVDGVLTALDRTEAVFGAGAAPALREYLQGLSSSSPLQ